MRLSFQSSGASAAIRSTKRPPKHAHKRYGRAARCPARVVGAVVGKEQLPAVAILWLRRPVAVQERAAQCIHDLGPESALVNCHGHA
jgi:hypothetical protein